MNQYVINVELVGENDPRTLRIRFPHLLGRDLNGFVHHLCVRWSQENLNQSPGAQHNPLVSMLACISDVCSFTIYASPFAFYHLYIDCNPPATHKETSMDGPSTDCKQSEPSHRVNNSEIRPEYLLTKAQAVRLRWDWGVERKRKTSGRLEGREWEMKRSNHLSDSDSSSDSFSSVFSLRNLQPVKSDLEDPDHLLTFLLHFLEKHPEMMTILDLLTETTVRSEHLLTRAAKSRLRGKKKKDFWTPRNWRQKED